MASDVQGYRYKDNRNLLLQFQFLAFATRSIQGVRHRILWKLQYLIPVVHAMIVRKVRQRNITKGRQKDGFRAGPISSDWTLSLSEPRALGDKKKKKRRKEEKEQRWQRKKLRSPTSQAPAFTRFFQSSSYFSDSRSRTMLPKASSSELALGIHGLTASRLREWGIAPFPFFFSFFFIVSRFKY